MASHKNPIIILDVIKIWKKRGKRYQGGGDKRHGNISNAIAKLFKMKFQIVNLVNKVIAYVKKKNNYEYTIKVLYLILEGWNGQRSAENIKEGVLQSIKNWIVIDYTIIHNLKSFAFIRAKL
jgi:hypothetical protein